MANWNMYTPWPFAELFEELGDRVEVRDYAKYNFVTPIIQPDAHDPRAGAQGRIEELRALLPAQGVPRIPLDPRPLQAPLHDRLPQGIRARHRDQEVLRSRAPEVQRPQRRRWICGFDSSKVHAPAELAALRESRPDLAADVDFKGTATPLPMPAPRRKRPRTPPQVMACGGLEHSHDPSDAEVLVQPEN